MLFSWFQISCDKSRSKDVPSPVDSVFTAHYSINDIKMDTTFDPGVNEGVLQEADLKEASGLACSKKHPGMLYAINDSDNPNVLFMFNINGQSTGTYTIEGATNRDWEDLDVGPGPQEGESYVFIADIGDNNGRWTEVYVYRMQEPALPALPQSGLTTVNHTEKFTLKYPDGAHNAETFFVDPITKDWYILTKEFLCRVYVARYPQDVGKPTQLKELGVLPFPFLVAGDMSKDGNRLLLKDYFNIYSWQRGTGESLGGMLEKLPQKVPYAAEPQGESVAWAPDASGYFTLGEQQGNDKPPVWFYRNKK